MPSIAWTAILTDWRTLVDVLIMTAGLFVLYRTLQRLGTWRIVLGILVAVCIFMLASLLDLRGIEWIFGNLSNVVVIALIVIFQPELRKLFERAASMRGRRFADPDGSLAMVLVDALFLLAEQRRGAIIVLPGRESVDEWSQGGHRLDARPSVPLVLSIFDPHSPGHDGALILKDGRFSRYGVRLPASQSSRLSEDWGTRHNASMGLSERSDALVLVVSEERGKISTFKNGIHGHVGDKQSLLDAVSSHWRETAAFPLELARGAAKRKVVLQLLGSFVLAALFWSTLIVAQGEMLEKLVTVPVEYTASSPQLAMVGDRREEVRLHLAGPKSDLDALSPAQLSVKIDLSKVSAGTQNVLITADNIRLPRGVQLLDVVPPSVTVAMAAITEQDMAVRPQLIGRLPQGLRIARVTVAPEKVRALAPPAAGKEKTASVSTTPIYLDSISESTTILGKIVAPPSIHPVDRRWPDVSVEVVVAPIK